MYEEKFMREAIRLAVENVKQGTGGPFGAVVVKEGKIPDFVNVSPKNHLQIMGRYVDVVS